MGRDFFDIIFLYEKAVQPDIVYLNKKLGIQDQDSLRCYIPEKSNHLNFKNLATDAQPFLFHAKDYQKILGFEDFVRQNL